MEESLRALQSAIDANLIILDESERDKQISNEFARGYRTASVALRVWILMELSKLQSKRTNAKL